MSIAALVFVALMVDGAAATALDGAAAGGCANSDGFIGFEFSHEGYWENYTRIPGKSKEECADYCGNLSSCFAFNMSPAGTCYTYDRTGAARPESGAAAYRRCTVQYTDGDYSVYEGTTIYGTADVFSGGNGFTKDSCRAKCDTDDSCKAYIFGESDGYCELWNRSENCGCTDPDFIYEIGFKISDPPTPMPVAPCAQFKSKVACQAEMCLWDRKTRNLKRKWKNKVKKWNIKKTKASENPAALVIFLAQNPEPVKPTGDNCIGLTCGSLNKGKCNKHVHCLARADGICQSASDSFVCADLNKKECKKDANCEFVGGKVKMCEDK